MTKFKYLNIFLFLLNALMIIFWANALFHVYENSVECPAGELVIDYIFILLISHFVWFGNLALGYNFLKNK